MAFCCRFELLAQFHHLGNDQIKHKNTMSCGLPDIAALIHDKDKRLSVFNYPALHIRRHFSHSSCDHVI